MEIPSTFPSIYACRTGRIAPKANRHEVRGDYQAGERLLVDTGKRIPSPAGVYVLWDGFGLVLKRLEIVLGSWPPMLRIKSINPAYETYDRPMDDVQVNGRVVGKWM